MESSKTRRPLKVFPFFLLYLENSGCIKYFGKIVTSIEKALGYRGAGYMDHEDLGACGTPLT